MITHDNSASMPYAPSDSVTDALAAKLTASQSVPNTSDSVGKSNSTSSAQEVISQSESAATLALLPVSAPSRTAPQPPQVVASQESALTASSSTPNEVLLQLLLNYSFSRFFL